MLYRITDGTVSAGGRVILSHVDFEIKGKEKIAVVGKNGAGKTTLLKLIAGEISLDRDDKRRGNGIVKSRDITIGMLDQSSFKDRDKTVEEILLKGCPCQEDFSRERFLYEMEYDRIFTGFGFAKEEKKRVLSSFSGGEQTKISLIRLLLQKPDILLLDEPTNHLDIPTVEWLEQYMREYGHAVVFVSHDRFFLDQVVDVVYELQDGRMKRYPGSYTDYRRQKRRNIAIQKKKYDSQQAEIARLNELIEQFKHKPKKAAFARSRKTVRNRMERIERPREDEAHIFTGVIEPRIPGSKWVFEAEHLKIGYGSPLLELSLRVKRGQKIGIIGDNGVGKSTFLKTVAGLLAPVEGAFTLGNNTLIGYFDQQSAALQSEKQVREHFSDLFPGLTEKEVRSILGAYLFGGQDAAKRVSDLSGGEKARLVLCELLTSRPNLLLLDEPTNHMDIPAKETLESAFSAYAGTILFVSHDRYFIDQVADAILIFEGNGVLYYPFGYGHYLKKSRQQEGGNLSAMIRAEDQALVADLKAVPKAERHRLKEIDTDEAYFDWRLKLVSEPMQEAANEVEQLYLRLERVLWEKTKSEWLREYADEACGSEDNAASLDMYNADENDTEELSRQLERAWEEWTNHCLAWYDTYNC